MGSVLLKEPKLPDVHSVELPIVRPEVLPVAWPELLAEQLAVDQPTIEQLAATPTVESVVVVHVVEPTAA